MLRLRTKLRPHPWPIWLLVLAWFCANCPQTVICTGVAWLGEARSFTHQQRLVSSVVHLLVGEQPHSLLAHVSSRPHSPAPSALPPLPELKKIDLAAEDPLAWVSPFSPPALRIRREISPRGILRAPPPHGPPRAGLPA